MADISDLLVRIDATTETLRRELKRAESSTQQTATKMDRSLQRVDRSFSRAGMTMRRDFSGGLQQAGFQVGDFATQIASGQSALVAFTQQGAQMAGAFGPGGAVLGAVLAIGGAVAGYFVRSMGEGEKATDALAASLERLDRVVQEQDGIQTLAKDIRELAKESEIAARARIVSAMAAAEQAARDASRGIRDAFDAVADTAGFSDLSDFFDVSSSTSGILTVREAVDDLRDSLGLTGAEGTEAARQIFDALKQLDASPTLANFRELEEAVSQVSTGIGESSKPLQTLVSDMAKFTDKARTAAERAEYLQSILAELAAGRPIPSPIEEIDTGDFPDRRKHRRATAPAAGMLDGDFINQALAKQKEAERFFQSTRTEVEQIEAQISRVKELAAGGFFPEGRDQQIIERLQAQLDELGQTTDNQFDQIAQSLAANFTGAFDEMFTSGKISAENFAQSILRDLARITAQLFIMKPLIEGLFGAGGGTSAFGKAVFSAFGFAKGGEFTVGGSGGPDSQLVPLKLSPGEHVKITPPGQKQAGGVTIHQTIDARGATPGSAAALRAAGQRISDETVARVFDMMRRGG